MLAHSRTYFYLSQQYDRSRRGSRDATFSHCLYGSLAVLLMILVSACGAKPTPDATTAPEATEPEFKDFDPSNFDNPTDINNEWMPMQPGTQWVYEGTAR